MTNKPVSPVNVLSSRSVISPGGRIDAICNIADSTWLCGGREVNGDSTSKGKIYKTVDGGKTWVMLVNIHGNPDINAMEYAGKGLVYALAGNGVLWRSRDNGNTWEQAATVSTSPTTYAIRTYGLIVLPSGTVLVCDTRTGGGKVYRSTDQGSTFDDGQILGNMELYRIIRTPNGAMVNGWAGRIYRTIDDGVSWDNGIQVSSGFLYGMVLSGGVNLVGDSLSRIYRSINGGQSWVQVAQIDGEIDDIIALSEKEFICSTFTGGLNVWYSDNAGVSWWLIGKLTVGEVDAVDRMANGYVNGIPCVVGGTTYGNCAIIKKPEFRK